MSHTVKFFPLKVHIISVPYDIELKLNRKLHLVFPKVNNMQPDFENRPLLSFLKVYAAYFQHPRPIKLILKTVVWIRVTQTQSQKCIFTYELNTNRRRFMLVN